MEIVMDKRYNGLTDNMEKFLKDCNTNNCYSYAINQPVHPVTGEKHADWTHVQPGNIDGRKGEVFTMQSVDDFVNIIELTKSDLEILGYDIRESSLEEYIDVPGAWKVAYATSSRDYHWYRQNDDGTWSHKKGPHGISNTDHIGDVIRNPEFCNRGGYSKFGGYYMIIPKAQEEKEAA